MKKILIAILLVIPFLLMSCKIWGEDDDLGQCVRYEKKALQVGIVEPSLKIARSMDSVKFWLGAKLVCAEYSVGMNFVTCDSDHNSNHIVSSCKEESLYLPAYDSSFIKSFIKATVYICQLGEFCNSETFESLHLTTKLYSHNDMGNVDSTVRIMDLPSINASYRIYNPEDSLVVNGIYKSFDNLLCERDFCLIQRKDDQLLCKDYEINSKIFYNECIWNWDEYL